MPSNNIEITYAYNETFTIGITAKDIYSDIFSVGWEEEPIYENKDITGKKILRKRRRLVIKMNIPFFDNLNSGLYKWFDGEIFDAPYFKFKLYKNLLPYQIFYDQIGTSYYTTDGSSNIVVTPIFISGKSNKSDKNNMAMKKNVEFTFESQENYYS
jgi:hypothetical protein